MKINMTDLRVLCQKILTQTENTIGNNIEVNFDYYWNVIYEEKYDFDSDSPKIVTGSFVDDWNSLKKNINTGSKFSIVDFDRLGNVIRILGDSISKNKKPF
ncbi:hypothetical protein ACFLYH_02890 [Candidatus Dependentiae bacterium]